MILAHSSVERISLPIPFWLTATIAVVLVVSAFFVNPTARQRIARRTCESNVVRIGLQALGLVAFYIVLIVAWLGPSALSSNPAPTWLYVWFWVGLIPLTLIFGNIYRVANPLRTISLLIAGISGFEPRPKRLDYWPAVAGLFAFLLIAVVSQEGDWPRVVAAFLTVYAVVNVSAGVWFGPRWFDRCDAFEVYFSVVASVWRPSATTSRSLTAFVLTAIGGVVADGMTHLSFWPQVDLVINPSDGDAVQSFALGAAVLGGAVVLLAGLWNGAQWATQRFLEHTVSLRPALIPVLVGFVAAHNVTALLFESQAGYLLAFGGGATNYSFFPTSAIAILQFLFVVAGLVGGAIVASRQIGRLPLVGRLPIVAMLASLTLVGVAVVSGS